MYRILFVGLICLAKMGAGRVALLPDALHEPNMPHIAMISINDPQDIVAKSGNWGAAAKANGDFLIEEASTIEFEDASTAVAAQPLKEVKLPVSLASNFKIAAQPKAIATIPILRGTLEAVLYPGSSKTNPDASVISQLDVPHDGNIHIIVTTKSGTVRTIELKPKTEIVVSNELPPALKKQLAEQGHNEHFFVYQRLGTDNSPSVGTTPKTPPNAFKVSKSTHRIFKGAGGVVGGVKCPNTGCCS